MHFWNLDNNLFNDNTGAPVEIWSPHKHFAGPIDSAFVRDQPHRIRAFAPILKQDKELTQTFIKSELLMEKKQNYWFCRRYKAYFGGFFSFPSHYFKENRLFINGFSFFNNNGRTGWTYIVKDLFGWDINQLNRRMVSRGKAGGFDVGRLVAFNMFAHQIKKERLVLQPRNFARTNRASLTADLDSEIDRTGLAFVKFYNQTAISPQLIHTYPYAGLGAKFTLSACNKNFELTSFLNLFNKHRRTAGVIRQTHSESFHYPFLASYLLSFVRDSEVYEIFDRFKGQIWKFGKKRFKYATRSTHFMRQLALAEFGQRFHGRFRIDSLSLANLALRLRKKSIADNRDLRMNWLKINATQNTLNRLFYTSHLVKSFAQRMGSITKLLPRWRLAGMKAAVPKVKRGGTRLRRRLTRVGAPFEHYFSDYILPRARAIDVASARPLGLKRFKVLRAHSVFARGLRQHCVRRSLTASRRLKSARRRAPRLY